MVKKSLKNILKAEKTSSPMQSLKKNNGFEKKGLKADVFNMKYRAGTFHQIEINLVLPDQNQPRKSFNKEKLNELAQSIKQHGIIEPLIIRINNNQQFILISGERRLKASKIAGLKKIPCLILKTDKPDELALIENIQREDLNPIEEAEAYKKLQEKYEYTQEQLANVVGKDRTTITQTLSLNNLPDEIKQECVRVHIPKRALISIVRQKNRDEQINLFEKLKNGEINSDVVLKKSRKPRKPNSPLLTITLQRVIEANKSLMKVVNHKETVNLDSEEGFRLVTLLDELKGIISAISSSRANASEADTKGNV